MKSRVEVERISVLGGPGLSLTYSENFVSDS